MNFLLSLCHFPWAKNIIKLHITNNSAKIAPYHNFNHALVVTENVWDAANHYNLQPYDLICAALWHDFNHSQGTLKDSLNVKIAIENFVEWFSCSDYGQAWIHNQINPVNVISIIQATEYQDGKYTIPKDNLSLEQKIIRDADLLQYAEKNRFGQVYLGLSHEMNVPLITLAKNAPTFINSIEPNTEWMLPKWETLKYEVLKELELIHNLLTDETA